MKSADPKATLVSIDRIRPFVVGSEHVSAFEREKSYEMTGNEFAEYVVLLNEQQNEDAVRLAQPVGSGPLGGPVQAVAQPAAQAAQIPPQRPPSVGGTPPVSPPHTPPSPPPFSPPRPPSPPALRTPIERPDQHDGLKIPPVVRRLPAEPSITPPVANRADSASRMLRWERTTGSGIPRPRHQLQRTPPAGPSSAMAVAASAALAQAVKEDQAIDRREQVRQELTRHQLPKSKGSKGKSSAGQLQHARVERDRSPLRARTREQQGGSNQSLAQSRTRRDTQPPQRFGLPVHLEAGMTGERDTESSESSKDDHTWLYKSKR